MCRLITRSLIHITGQEPTLDVATLVRDRCDSIAPDRPIGNAGAFRRADLETDGVNEPFLAQAVPTFGVDEEST